MKNNAPQGSKFEPAKRYQTNQSNETLKRIAAKATLEADMHRLASIDGDTPCVRKLITQHQNIAASAEAEIILRSIFKY